MNCRDISGVEGISQCYFYCGFPLLWERLRIYSGKLFIAMKIKSVNIYAIPFIFSTTLLLPVLDITGFFFRIRAETEYECGKGNPLYPIRAASFVSIVLYHTLNIERLFIAQSLHTIIIETIT